MAASFDLRQVAIAALDRMIESEALEKCVADQVAKSVAEIVKDHLSTYGTFGKQLKEAVSKALAIHGDIDLPSYNDSLRKIIAAQVQGLTESTIQHQVAKNLKELLMPAPAEITLSALVEQYREMLKEKARSGCVCHGEAEITCDVESSDYGFKHIVLDESPNVARSKCDIDIGVSSMGEVYHLRFKNQDVEKSMFAGPFYGFERLLFQMRAAKSKIVFDVEPYDIEKRYALYED